MITTFLLYHYEAWNLNTFITIATLNYFYDNGVFLTNFITPRLTTAIAA